MKQNMFKLLLFALILFLSSCTNSISPAGYRWAEEVCGNNGGVRVIHLEGPWLPIVECNNTAKFQATKDSY